MPLQEEEGNCLDDDSCGDDGAEGSQLRFCGLYGIQLKGQLRFGAGFADRAFFFVSQGLNPAFPADAPHMERTDFQRPNREFGRTAAADTFLCHF